MAKTAAETRPHGIDRPLPRGDGLELARRIREGEDSSEAAVHRALARIAERNPELSAFVSVSTHRSLAAARRKDRARAGGEALPPFHGVPVGIKDLHLVRGHFARFGSRAYRWLVSPWDDVTAAAIRRAGFVIIGKLSTSELGLLPFVEPDIHAPTRNPWSVGHSPGGSSAGSGAAIASGMLLLAAGSDGGGSVRIPASYCGVFGHKPSRGLLPSPNDRMDPNRMTTTGPLARGVEDAAALLDILGGGDPGAPGSFHQAIEKTPRPLRVRMALRSPIGETDPEIEAAVRRVGGLLTELGHHVEEVEPPKASAAEFLPCYARLFADIPVLSESRLQATTRWFREEGRKRTHADALAAYVALRDKVTAWFGDVDLLLAPTSPVPPPRIGAFTHLPPAEQWEAIAPIAAFTAGFNASGNPACSVPAGFTAAGLSIGRQCRGGRRGDRSMRERLRRRGSRAADARRRGRLCRCARRPAPGRDTLTDRRHC